MLDSLQLLSLKPLAVALPVFSGMSWWYPGAVLFLLALIFFGCKRKRRPGRYWNDYFVDPPEYQDPETAVEIQHNDLFKHYLRRFLHKKSTEILKIQEEPSTCRDNEKHRNSYLWDDGMIFCGFKLQGTDFRYAGLYGAYLRDRFLLERGLGGFNTPLIFTDAEAYTAVDMSGAFLKSDLRQDIILNRVDWGRTDLSGMYLRNVGLPGIDPGEFLKPEENGLSDFLIAENSSDKTEDL
ncbi:MAG: hypothetical protein PHV59_06520 [Victivallales bacterium]|nr:hypothetical protein [Victivallales bacterium]